MQDNPHLAEIHIYPIKSLDGVSVPACRIGPGGGLVLDRAWALCSEDGRFINGKSTAAIHLIRAVFAADVSSVTLSTGDGRRDVAPETFEFPGDFAGAGEWFSRFFERQVVARYAAEGFPDDTDRNGPTVISTATLQAVADWFPGMDLGESRRRFRTSLEIGGVPAFWEDRLFGVDERDPIRFTVGDVNVEGTNPCPRCTVPARDSLSGNDMIGFQKRFSALRRTHYPSWACQPERIDRLLPTWRSIRAWRRPNMGRCCGLVIWFRCADAAPRFSGRRPGDGRSSRLRARAGYRRRSRGSDSSPGEDDTFPARRVSQCQRDVVQRRDAGSWWRCACDL